MKTRSILRGLSSSALVLGFGLVSGCGDDGVPGSDCEFQAKIDAVGSAADALVATSASMRSKLIVACSKIAGKTAMPSTTPTDAQVKTECDAAVLEINAKLGANAMVTVVPGKCEVAASAQLECEGKCDVDAKCDPGTIEARCTPAELSVECSGSCAGSVTCEGSATVAANCDAVCNGTCTGTCDGTCNGTCEGTCSAMDAAGKCTGTCTGTCEGACSADCTGTCKGDCTYAAGAMVDCDVKARCKGGCTGTATAPKCEAELQPPSCTADAECEAGCKGQADFKAECKPPTVVIAGSADAEFATMLQGQLPVVIEVLEEGKLALEAVTSFSSASRTLVASVSDAPACVLKVGGAFTSKLGAAVDASVSVQASVMVSGSVSGSAG